MTTLRTRSRIVSYAAIAAVLATAAPLTAAPALATSAPSAPGAQGTAATPATEVNRFLTAYRHAVLGVGTRTPGAIRKAYLTKELDARLSEWAVRNHADPVLRAQNVPKDWKVRNHSTTAGTSKVVVTQIWGGAPDTRVWYTVRRSDLKIVNLTDPPRKR
ncbi:hypothetical protein [Streptomyces candidus]|uniref:Uncharacterized protein n=1 Tax=Streptomyces candidus TaxID=67283 RepID=A0A7X0HM46_9ACTN|nr:hypothetical protein [Streptomyces candidus]MBB6438919.1 hypothetical protein [Streptomyces candidus]GHH44251.1 hypothetical protein GCM10018773_31550 [Streptomyces candidus]